MSGLLQHKQVLIKANAKVDKGIAPLIKALCEFDFIQTHESCEGRPGDEDTAIFAYVYFSCGHWVKMADFVFKTLAPRLGAQVDDRPLRLTVLVCDDDDPVVKLEMSAEAIGAVTQVVKDVKRMMGVQKYGSSRGMART